MLSQRLCIIIQPCQRHNPLGGHRSCAGGSVYLPLHLHAFEKFIPALLLACLPSSAHCRHLLRRAIENILGFEPTRRIVKAARFGLLMGGTAFVDFFVFAL